MDVRIIKPINSYYTRCQKTDDYVQMQVMSIDGQVKDVCAKIPSSDLCLKCEKRQY